MTPALYTCAVGVPSGSTCNLTPCLHIWENSKWWPRLGLCTYMRELEEILGSWFWHVPVPNVWPFECCSSEYTVWTFWTQGCSYSERDRVEKQRFHHELRTLCDSKTWVHAFPNFSSYPQSIAISRLWLMMENWNYKQ